MTDRPVVDVQTLCFFKPFTGGRTLSFSLKSFPFPRMALEILHLIDEETKANGSIKSPGSAQNLISSLRNFARCVNSQYIIAANIFQLRDITESQLNTFVEWIANNNTSDSNAPYHVTYRLVHALRLADNHQLISSSLADRLRFIVGRQVFRRISPRNPYSSFVSKQLLEQAEREIEEAANQILVTGKTLLADGRDPSVDGWDHPANVVWAIRNQGITNTGEAPLADLGPRNRFGELLAHVHLSNISILAFQIAISLKTGLPFESLRELRIDCIANRHGGFADIRYIKRRRGGQEAFQAVRVSAEGKNSAIALIELLLKLTENSRRLTPSDEKHWLFLGATISNRYDAITIRRQKSNTSVTRSFCKKYTILDDDLSRIDGIVLARLRKTYKAERYRQAPGIAAASDHTKSVHDRHYANVEALLDLHEQTLDQGLTDAYSAAMRSTIVETEASPIADDSGKEHDSKEDVWLASCTDMHDSPYDQTKSNDLCKIPVWGCLACKNAVITVANLPGILAFLDHMLAMRQCLDLKTWASRYGRVHGLITSFILPRFDATELARAKEQVEIESQLLWLPAELTASH